MTGFVILNQCSDAALTPDLLQQIATALEVQLNRDFAPYWGGNYRVRAATPENPPAPGEVVALISDDLPDAPGAVGYHDWQGHPVIYVARNMCSSLTTGDFSVSQCLSHELCEEALDDACNAWRDDMAGSEWAQEACDAVEGGYYTYNLNGPGVAVDLSDFLLPEFFKPGSLGPYSFLQKSGGNGPPAPFTTAPGGYQIQRKSGTGETQVTGEIRHHKLAKRRHWSSRTYRRGVRLAA